MSEFMQEPQGIRKSPNKVETDKMYDFKQIPSNLDANAMQCC